MIFKRLLNKLLFFIGIKSFRWKLAICEQRNKNIKILKVFNPGFFEFWADPFLIKHNHKKYIFFECYNYFSKKGKIQCFQLKNNKIINRKTILKKKYHLSYPHIYRFKKKFYLIPESYEDNQTSIYVSLKFPYKWKKINTIFKGEKVCDTTVFFKNKKIWLFVNKAKNNLQDFNNKLYIYKSDSINFENLKSHMNNPVIKSLNSTRNAGNIFVKGKSYYRPAQINKKNIYGYGFSINKILKLDEKKFDQVDILKVTPKNFKNKNICGVHHYNKINNKTFLTDLCFRYSF